MKTPFLAPGAIVLALFGGLTACNDADQATETLPTASFSFADLSFSEAEGEQVLTLVLDRPALSAREVIVSVHCPGTAPISTEPAIIDGVIKAHVSAGKSTIDIKVFPVNNCKLDGTREVSMSILPVEGSYRVGFVGGTKLTIADDESPSRIEFTERAASWTESEQGGFQVNIRFSAAAPAAGIVILEAETESKYSRDFTTIPSIVNGKIYLPVGEGQSGVSLLVYASNDNVKQPDRHILFRVSDASGGVMHDGYLGTFQLSIVEDDTNAALLPMLPLVPGEGIRDN